MQGFFPATTYTKRPLPLIAKCGQCELHLTCDNPKMPCTGHGRKGILIVGESPGWNEMEKNRQFVGKAGIELESALARVGVDMRRDCWLTNAVICRVSGRAKKNQTPTEKHVSYCRPNLTKTMLELQPYAILVLGPIALQSVLMGIWTDSIGTFARWIGWDIPCQKLNTWVCPTWHPQHILRTEKDKNHVVVKRMWETHLEQAASHKSKPWKTIPDWESKIEIFLDVREIPKILDEMAQDGSILAIDIENTPLKPYNRTSEIISCSVSNGKRTVSYLWMGEAIQATLNLLRSSVPKVLQNEKHERLWFKGKYDVEPRNVVWDTMLAGHWIDNRPGICSLSFQSFVYLGVPKHNEHIEPFFKGKGGNGHNRIKELDRATLLRYGGLDSLMELKLAKRQSSIMGIALD